MRAVPRLCELYPGIGLTTEEKAQKKNLSQGTEECQYTYYQNTHMHTHTLQNNLKQP